MCGIAGILHFERERPVDRHALTRMAGAMAHRGPDASGVWTSGPIGFAHRRLAIIDLNGGRQPAVSPETVTDDLLERVIGETRDFQFIEFLEQAVFASRSVGRVVTKLGGGRMSFGTGFMVSPRLFLTNHHVLTSMDDAARSVVEFDYQRDRLGRPLAIRTFQLDPQAFFLNDKALDFALVAVNPDGPGRPRQSPRGH